MNTLRVFFNNKGEPEIAEIRNPKVAHIIAIIHKDGKEEFIQE
jgi:hypothetical protein